MPQVQVPKEFFIKERNQVYSDWGRAFFRELMSNSVDAHATCIHINFRELDEGFEVMFADNGVGMDKEILLNYYFRLGASTKETDKGSIGGFGRARILTNFSHENYEIYTREYVVHGDGAQYDFVDTSEHEFVEGCIQIVRIKGSLHAFKSYCISFLSTCQIELEIYVDGERFKDFFIPKKFVKVLEDRRGIKAATLYVSPDKDVETSFKNNCAHNLLLRVNGCTMYSEFFPGKNVWTIELDPSRAREFLTASRDSVKDDMKAIINGVRTSVQSSEREMIRQAEIHVERIQYEGSGVLIVEPGEELVSWFKTEKEDNKILRDLEPTFSAREVIEKNIGYKVLALKTQISLTPSKFVHPDEIHNVSLDNGTPEKHQTYKVSDFIPNIQSSVRSYLDTMRAAYLAYDPSLWQFTVEGNQLRMKDNKDKWNLYVAWETCITYCLKALSVRQTRSSYRYTCGFIFDEDVEGEHYEDATSVHHYFFRPVNDKGFNRFNPNSIDDFMFILEIAKHEVTHTVCPSHDEDFIQTHFRLGSLIDVREVFKTYKNSKII